MRGTKVEGDDGRKITKVDDMIGDTEVFSANSQKTGKNLKCFENERHFKKSKGSKTMESFFRSV